MFFNIVPRKGAVLKGHGCVDKVVLSPYRKFPLAGQDMAALKEYDKLGNVRLLERLCCREISRADGFSRCTGVGRNRTSPCGGGVKLVWARLPFSLLSCLFLGHWIFPPPWICLRVHCNSLLLLVSPSLPICSSSCCSSDSGGASCIG